MHSYSLNWSSNLYCVNNCVDGLAIANMLSVTLGEREREREGGRERGGREREERERERGGKRERGKRKERGGEERGKELMTCYA